MKIKNIFCILIMLLATNNLKCPQATFDCTYYVDSVDNQQLMQIKSADGTQSKFIRISDLKPGKGVARAITETYTIPCVRSTEAGLLFGDFKPDSPTLLNKMDICFNRKFASEFSNFKKVTDCS